MFSWKALHRDPRYKEKKKSVHFSSLNYCRIESKLTMCKGSGCRFPNNEFYQKSLYWSPDIEEEILWSSCKVSILTALSQQILYGM